MKGKWFAVVSATWLAASMLLVAQSIRPRAQFSLMLRLPTPTIMTCQNGEYSEDKAGRLPGGDVNCRRQPRMTATAIAIDVRPSAYATVDNPPCPTGNTDATTLALIRTQVGTGTTTATLYPQLQRRAELLGSDASLLIQGAPGSQANTSTCQLLVVRVPVKASEIRVIEFRAHQNQANDNPRCFEAHLFPSKTGEHVASPSSGGCAIGWSGWQSATIVDDANGALVSGVFKNWSHDRTRTGQIWVWYGGLPLPMTVPRAPSGTRIIR